MIYLIHFKNLCKCECHNVPPSSTTRKEEKNKPITDIIKFLVSFSKDIILKLQYIIFQGGFHAHKPEIASLMAKIENEMCCKISKYSKCIQICASEVQDTRNLRWRADAQFSLNHT
jgi:hypothetical protein